MLDEVKAFLVIAAAAARLYLQTQDDPRWLLIGLGGLFAAATGITLTTFMRRPEYLEATGAPPIPPATERGDHAPKSLSPVALVEALGQDTCSTTRAGSLRLRLQSARHLPVCVLGAHLLYLGRASLIVSGRARRTSKAAHESDHRCGRHGPAPGAVHRRSAEVPGRDQRPLDPAAAGRRLSRRRHRRDQHRARLHEGEDRRRRRALPSTTTTTATTTSWCRCSTPRRRWTAASSSATPTSCSAPRWCAPRSRPRATTRWSSTVAGTRPTSGRMNHPVEEGEVARVDDGRVTLVGKKTMPPDEATGEFIGLARFSARAARAMRERFHARKASCAGKPYGRAPRFEVAYLTDLLNDLIDSGRGDAAGVHRRRLARDRHRRGSRARQGVSGELVRRFCIIDAFSEAHLEALARARAHRRVQAAARRPTSCRRRSRTRASWSRASRR